MQTASKTSLVNDPNRTDKLSFLFWLTIAGLFLYLFLSPFFRGLFIGGQLSFESDILIVIGSFGFVGILFSMYLLPRLHLHSYSDGLALGIWLLPLIYFITTFFAASAHYAINYIFYHIIYCLMFMVGVYLTRSDLGLRLVTNAILWSGYLLLIFVYANYFGNISYTDALWGKDLRFSSVFQYPNTYAAYLIALIISTLYLCIVKSNKRSFVIYAFLTTPLLLAFILTLSRGAYLFLPALLFLFLFLLNFQQQIRLVMYTSISVLFSVIAYPFINGIGAQIQESAAAEMLSFKGWILLAAFSTVTAGVIWLLEKYLIRWFNHKTTDFSRNKSAYFMVPLVCLIIGGIAALALLTDNPVRKLLPANIVDRISEINFQENSVLERATFYEDAAKIVWKSPFFGSGGGAWTALYETYQNNPYTSRQAHNFLMTYLVEIGIIGTLVLLVVTISGVILFLKNYLQSNKKEPQLRMIFFIFAVSILAHSVIDFNMSFFYISSLVFLSLGGMISNSGGTFSKVASTTWWGQKLLPLSLAILMIMTMVYSVRQHSAIQDFEASVLTLQTTNRADDTLRLLDASLKKSPKLTDALIFKLSLLNQIYLQTKDETYAAEARQTIEAIEKYYPTNKSFQLERVRYFDIAGQQDEAIESLKLSVELFPWEINFYNELVKLLFAFGNENEEQQDEYWGQIQPVIDEVQQRVEYLETLPEGQRVGRPFAVTEDMKQIQNQIL